MSHYSDREIAIEPGAGAGWAINPGAGAMSDFLAWIATLLDPFDDETPLIDRRDIAATIPLGYPQVPQAPAVERNELSDLVIAESPIREAAVLDPVVELIDPTQPFPWHLYPLGGPEFATWQGAQAARAELQQIVDMTPLQEAEAILMQPIWEAEVTDVGDFFDNLGDVFLDVAGTYFQQGRAAPMGFDSPPAPFPTADPLMAPLQAGPGAPPGVACATKCGPYPVWKRVCGVYQWVYPKRRRRRQLLTESDYNGLLRIESLKVNKNMTVAIAKALTR